MDSNEVKKQFHSLNSWQDGQKPATDEPAKNPKGVKGAFAGRYQIVDKIGMGGMASLYRVKDLLFGEELAIKIMRAEVAKDKISQQRFRQEARAARELNHPHIVSVRAFDISPEGIPFMIMDYIDGADLGKIVRNNPISIKTFFKIFIQVSGALVHAHSRGVIHRDVKPSNMLISLQGDSEVWVKLVDFGIAKLLYPLDDEDPGSHVLTRTGQTVGSPAYMSPEQAQGKPVDARADIYSLGCVMFEALTGQMPFKASNAVQLAVEHATTQAPTVQSLNKLVSNDIERIIQHCMEKRPEDRYQNMFDLRTDLQLVEQGREPLLRTGASTAPAISNDSLFDLIKKDTNKALNCVLEGNLSYDMRLNSVLEQIHELGYRGDSILRLKSLNPPFTGIIVVRDGRQVISARILNETVTPYEALRRMMAMADGEYKYSTIRGDDYNLPESPFVLNLNYLLSLYPNLPESISELVDQNAVCDLVFAVKSDQGEAVDSDYNMPQVEQICRNMDDIDESWRPMVPIEPRAPQGQAESGPIQQELRAISQKVAVSDNKKASDQSLFKRLMSKGSPVLMALIVVSAMLAMGFQIVKNTSTTMQQNSRHSSYKRKRYRKYRRHSLAPNYGQDTAQSRNVITR